MKLDWWLVIPCLLLSLLGLTVLRAVSPELSFTQLLFFILASLVFLVVSQTDYVVFPSLSSIGYFFSLIFLVTPFLFGEISRGAHRWLQFGSFSLQPSEVVKPLLLTTFSTLAASNYNQKLTLLVLSVFFPSAVIFSQPDLGTTLVILVGWITIALTQFPIKAVVATMLGLIVFSVPIYSFMLQDYQKQRLITFLDPYHDPLGQGYHVIQSIIAMGSGGWAGRGLGHGTQSNLRFLPEYHTDFIFATLGESLGFVGSVSVVILFLFLIRRIYAISQATDVKSSSFFCIASASMLAFQVFVNIGMNIGLAPVTGITLPFLSYGGSSLLSLGITMGIVNSISKGLSKSSQ